LTQRLDWNGDWDSIDGEFKSMSALTLRYPALERFIRHWAGAAALSLRVLQESQIKGCKHQDYADVRYQPFPESILEEQ